MSRELGRAFSIVCNLQLLVGKFISVGSNGCVGHLEQQLTEPSFSSVKRSEICECAFCGFFTSIRFNNCVLYEV